MGMTISVQAHTYEEAISLDSEGAPQLHLSYGRSERLLGLFGIYPDDCVGTIDPDEILSAEDEALARADLMETEWVLTADGGKQMNLYPEHVRELVRIAQTAHNLRRAIGFG